MANSVSPTLDSTQNAEKSSENQQVSEKKQVINATTSAIPKPTIASAQVSPPLFQAVYKGCTTDAQGKLKEKKHVHPVSIPCTPVVHGLLAALKWLGMLEMTQRRG
jgi:hypothetical protein